MKRNNVVSSVLFICFTATGMAHAQEGLETHKQQFSYAMGVQLGQSIKQQQQQLNLDITAFTQAMQDVLNDSGLKLTPEQMQAVVDIERKKAQEAQEIEQKARADLATKNQELGTAFLAENKTRDGVNVTESGLQYEVMKIGTGKQPTLEDTVVVHYRGTLVNGQEFDSSYERGEPATFPLKGVIPGWQEGLQLMKEGATWKVVIPANLAYGEKGAGRSIGPNATLVFEVELLEIK